MISAKISVTGPHSAAGNMSGMGHEFDPSPFHTFIEIYHEVLSMVIPPPSAESFKKGCCKLQTKICKQNTG